ncbi:hypothetical protein AWB80_05384 [Caballeronia pedi]|uniref:Uncharacterized protein n=1 Tax=Caballeronia pedi TaxID=1777141 RepID=A0A158CK26_9BURK|nr:hypothetical protein AWB80_05384 [Caballeronia pedi]
MQQAGNTIRGAYGPHCLWRLMRCPRWRAVSVDATRAHLLAFFTVLLAGARCARRLPPRKEKRSRASPRASQTSLTPESRRRRLIGAGAATTTQDLVPITSFGTKYSGHPRSLKKVYLPDVWRNGVDFCYRKARQGLARNAVAPQRERPYAALRCWAGRGKTKAARRCRDACAASRNAGRDRSCGQARCRSGRPRHRSDSASR